MPTYTKETPIYNTGLIRDSLNDIRDKTDLLVDGTAESNGEKVGPLIELTAEGRSEQDGTPSPSNPVDIQVVRARNLFNPKKGYWQKTNGQWYNTGDSLYYISTSDILACEPGETFCLSNLGTTTNRYVIYYYNNVIVQSANSNTMTTFTIPEDINGFAVDINYGSQEAALAARPQLERGDTPHDYIPYGGLLASIQGKNLVDSTNSFSSWYCGRSSYFTFEDNLITVNAAAKDWAANISPLRIPYSLVKNKTVTLSYEVRTDTANFSSASGEAYPRFTLEGVEAGPEPSGYADRRFDLILGNTDRSKVTSDWTRITHTIQNLEIGISKRNLVDGVSIPWARYNSGLVENVTYISLRLWCYFVGVVQFKNIQLEISDTATSYEPYIHHDIMIPLPKRGWVGGLSKGTPDTLRLDGSGNVTWELNTKKREIEITSILSNVLSTGRVGGIFEYGANVGTQSDALCSRARKVSASASEIDNGTFYVNPINLVLIGDTDDTLATMQAKYNGGEVLYLSGNTVIESCGHIDIPEIPVGASISIPELDNLNVKYYLSNLANANKSTNDLAIAALKSSNPLATKIYTGVIGTANDVNNASLYFGKVHPKVYTSAWKIKLNISVLEPSAYSQYINIDVCGDNSNHRSYNAFVQVNAGRGIYYVNLYRATAAGIGRHVGHALGFGLYASANPANAAYARTIQVDVLEAYGCEVELLDEAVKYTDIPGYASSNYGAHGGTGSTLTTMGVATNGQNATNNVPDTYMARFVNYYNTVKAKTAILSETIIAGSSAGYEIVVGGTAFDLSYPVLWCTANLAVNATNYANIYLEIYDRNLAVRYDSVFTTGAKGKLVYLVGTVSGNTFTVDSSGYLTCDTPTTNNGKVYIPIGRIGNTSTTNKNYFIFSTSVPVQLYTYKDGAFGPASIREAAEAAKTATNYIFADSTGIKIANGTPETATTYQHQTYDRTEFFVNNESKALIGGSGIRLGKPFEEDNDSNESHVKIDYHSLQMIDVEGEPYLYISDLRDENGQMTDIFPERETAANHFSLRTHVESCISVKVGGVEDTSYNLTQGIGDSRSFISLRQSTTDEVEVVYIPSVNNTWISKAYTLGRRNDDYDIGMGSVVMGHNCAAIGLHSYSEGRDNKACGPESHAEGYSTTAGYLTKYAAFMDIGAHAEGYGTTAYGIGAHAEGMNTVATEMGSHAQNYYTEARSMAQTAIGKYNIVDDDDIYAAIIGNGTSNSNRSNAFAVKWDGEVETGYRITQAVDTNNKAYIYATTQNRNAPWVRVIGGPDANGDAVVIGDGGLLIIGSGESAANLYSDLIDNEICNEGSERTYIASDSVIYLVPNCNSLADKLEYSIDNVGVHMPNNTALRLHSLIDQSVTPESTIYEQPYEILDANGDIIGHSEYSQSTSRRITHNFAAVRQKTDDTTWTWYQCSMRVDVDGTVTYGINTPSAFRDALGASSGKWPASLIETLNQDTTGNAGTATKLKTAREIYVALGTTRDANSPVTFDGSAAKSIHVSGTLPAARGGTGNTSLQATRNAMGLGNTTGALPIANGGTGSTSKADALTALGAQAALSVTTASSGIFTAGSGVTIVSQNYAQYGKVAQIALEFKISSAKTATTNTTVATISTAARRPKIQTGASVGISTDIRAAWIDTNGQCHVQAAITANTSYYFWATYIIP